MRGEVRGGVMDESALVSLLDADPLAFSIWTRADRGEAELVIPVGVILDVARDRGVAPTSWGSILWPAGVKVPSLSESVAVEIGTWSGSLAARHALWESKYLGWPIFTQAPHLYGPDVDVIVI